MFATVLAKLLTPETELKETLRFAVIGHPISHSRSPDIHALFAKQTGIDLEYGRIDADPDKFEAIVHEFFEHGGKGLNVTVPFKERAFDLARNNLSQRALRAAAVNTLWQVNGQIHGCNTDGVGLLEDLKRLDMLGHAQRILLLGAGGAARGVLGPLLESGCQWLQIANRTVSRAQVLCDQWIEQSPEDASRLGACSLEDPVLNQPWDLIINATSGSLSGQAIALPANAVTAQTGVYDMMYGAAPTPFLEHARQLGAIQLADGLGMLVGQAAESFRIWNGIRPDIEPVLQQIRSQLKG